MAVLLLCGFLLAFPERERGWCQSWEQRKAPLLLWMRDMEAVCCAGWTGGGSGEKRKAEFLPGRADVFIQVFYAGAGHPDFEKSAQKKGEGMMAFRAALYIRLSREDGDREESDSVANQRKMLMSYVEQREELSLGEIYVDDGCSGTNFERPAFRRMLEDIEAGQINCVIVKDLSRFGRDYIDTGRYLERYFPEKRRAFYRCFRWD